MGISRDDLARSSGWQRGSAVTQAKPGHTALAFRRCCTGPLEVGRPEKGIFFSNSTAQRLSSPANRPSWGLDRSLGDVSLIRCWPLNPQEEKAKVLSVAKPAYVSEENSARFFRTKRRVRRTRAHAAPVFPQIVPRPRTRMTRPFVPFQRTTRSRHYGSRLGQSSLDRQISIERHRQV